MASAIRGRDPVGGLGDLTQHLHRRGAGAHGGDDLVGGVLGHDDGGVLGLGEPARGVVLIDETECRIGRRS